MKSMRSSASAAHISDHWHRVIVTAIITVNVTTMAMAMVGHEEYRIILEGSPTEQAFVQPPLEGESAGHCGVQGQALVLGRLDCHEPTPTAAGTSGTAGTSALLVVEEVEEADRCGRVEDIREG